MKIDSFVLSGFGTNAYLLRKESDDKDCLIIDPGLEPFSLINYIEENGLNPLFAVLTHGHADHTAGLSDLKEKWPGLKTAIHKFDADMMTDPDKNLSMLAGYNIVHEPADILIEEEGFKEFGTLGFEVIRTSGHTGGGISLYSENDKVVFTGDALFAGGVGRTDFPGGDMDELICNIKQKLLSLPDDTKVLPGHGPGSTIGAEKQGNPFLR